VDALWVDEYWSIYNAGGAHLGPLSPAEIWTRVATQDPWQSPGYFMLLAGWGSLVGWTAFAARALSLLAGLLAIAWTYRLGHDLVSPLGGLAAAVTMGASAYFLYYFHEVRGYALLVALTPPTLWAYWRLVNQKGGWRTQAVFFLGSLSLFYTHYFGALPLVVMGVYHLLVVKKDRRWWRPFLLMGAAGLLFLPWMGALVSGLTIAVKDTARQLSAWTPRQIVQGTLFMFSNGSIVLVIVLGLYSLRRNPVVIFVWFCLLGLFGLILLVNARLGVVLEARYLLPLWPMLALVVALALERLAQTTARRLIIFILGLWLLAGVWNSIDGESAYTLSNPHWHQPWDILAESLRPRELNGDALLYLLPDWTWPAYHEDVLGYYFNGSPVRTTLLQRPENIGADGFARQEREAVTEAARVWVGYTTNQPTHYIAAAERLLAENGYLYCGSFSQASPLALDLYGRANRKGSGVDFRVPENPDVKSDQPSIRLDFITSQSVIPQRDRQAGHLNVTAFWSIDADVAPSTYSVGLHVENLNGQLVAQVDYGLPTEPHVCHSTDIPLSNLPSGDYRLLVAVYAWQTGERLAVGGGTGDRAEVGVFTLSEAATR